VRVSRRGATPADGGLGRFKPFEPVHTEVRLETDHGRWIDLLFLSGGELKGSEWRVRIPVADFQQIAEAMMRTDPAAARQAFAKGGA